MESRLLQLGKGAFLYKTDLARGYRQLRVDPNDWPLLGIQHNGEFFLDICLPFGLSTSALFMQRTSEAISWMHGQAGYVSKPYLDDFGGGAEATREEGEAALGKLQQIMQDLGVVETKHKVCGPLQQLIWLGLLYDSIAMTISIHREKLQEIMCLLKEWEGWRRATQRELQSLLGTLQFVASVSPPTRIFTNRMLTTLREAPRRGSETLLWGFKQDLQFFLDMLPHFNGVKIVDKDSIPFQESLELDACLTRCGACTDYRHYAERFPEEVLRENHSIAHLKLLNVVVAVKVWREEWQGKKVRIYCDNANACCAVQFGRSKDDFIQKCVRELFFVCAVSDIELHLLHRPGRLMVRADALSRAHTGAVYRDRVAADLVLAGAERGVVPTRFFELVNKL